MDAWNSHLFTVYALFLLSLSLSLSLSFRLAVMRMSWGQDMKDLDPLIRQVDR